MLSYDPLRDQTGHVCSYIMHYHALTEVTRRCYVHAKFGLCMTTFIPKCSKVIPKELCAEGRVHGCGTANHVLSGSTNQ